MTCHRGRPGLQGGSVQISFNGLRVYDSCIVAYLRHIIEG